MDGDDLAAVKITTLPAVGSLTLNNVPVTAGQVIPVADINSSLLKYAPPTNAFGLVASIDFQVQDDGGTANGGVDLDQSPNKLSIQVNSSDTTAPRISGVYVNSTAWSSAFRDFADGGFTTASALGYELPTGSNQLVTLPWININQILVKFDSNVGASLDVTDFNLDGSTAGVRADGSTATVPRVLTVQFNPTTFVATLTLSQSIEPSVIVLGVSSSGVFDVSGNRLDGEWTNSLSTVSGNAAPGGDFVYQFNVLPGDAAGAVPNANYTNSVVVGADQILVANSQDGFLADGIGAFDGYTIFVDVNGSGDFIDVADVIAVRNRVGSKLLKP